MADIFNSMSKEIKTRQMFFWEDQEMRKARDGDFKNSKWFCCHPMTIGTIRSNDATAMRTSHKK